MRRTIGIAALALSMAVALAACNGGGEDESPSPSAADTTSPSPTEELAEAAKGEYLYKAYGVTANMTLAEGDTWDMKVANDTGHELGKPSVYALDALDGTRINAKIEGASPLGNGKTQDLTVTWDERFVPEDIGLVILVFGTDNFGNFAYGR